MASSATLTQEKVGRLEIEHQLLKIAAVGLYRAPLIAPPRRILQVFCGTSACFWGRDMAQKYLRAEQAYSAQVLGVDDDAAVMSWNKGIAPPPNFRFVKADILNGPLPFVDFVDGEFDFTYARFLSSCLPTQSWIPLLGEMARVTRPGGYVEVVDQEPVQTTSTAFLTLNEACQRWLRQQNLHPAPGPYLADWLCQVGLKQVQGRRILVGSGPQESSQQRLMATNFGAYFSQKQTPVVKAEIISSEVYSAALDCLKQELQAEKIIWPIVHAFGMRALQQHGQQLALCIPVLPGFL